LRGKKVVAVAGWGLGEDSRPWRQWLGVSSIGERRSKSSYVHGFSSGPMCSPVNGGTSSEIDGNGSFELGKNWIASMDRGCLVSKLGEGSWVVTGALFIGEVSWFVAEG
jgi:hypothetical protein